MWITLITMRGAGMLTKEDLADFSPPLQEEVFGDFSGGPR